ncbi:DUF3131 domain-containing protein [Tabrizicola aquatica]|uniref:DUF3131 domain-containing protein n=1 Tax=Tabrizicola aquatica TaxID=909926 RepID=UPI000CD2467A|nr:DUF3131 domain-containing protein [Tabrizicola aquatica]
MTGRLTRRALLGAAAALPGVALPLRLAAQTGAAQLSLLLDGIGPGLPPALLQAVVAPFLAAGLPVTCIADLAALAPAGGPRDPLCDVLAALARGDPGLFDLALPIGKLPRPERYFQLRRAGELRAAVLRAFAEGPAAGQSFPVVTLVDRGEDPNIDHTAFRGAGFRVHLTTSDGPFAQQVAGRGELVASGGIWSRLDAPDLMARLSEPAPGLLALTLTAGSPGLADQAQRLARSLAEMQAAGRLRLTSPAQRRLYADAGLAVDIALLVAPGTTLEEDEALLAFTRDLAAQGVPLTLTGHAERYGALPGTVAFCALQPADPAAALPPPACQRGPDGPPDALSLPVPVQIGAEPAIWTAQGIDPDGRLRLTLRDLASPEAALDLSPLEDHLIAVRAADVMLPAKREQLVRRLVDAALAGRAYFHTLPGLADHLVATEPVLARLWSIRRRVLTDPLQRPSPDTAERDRLIQDARLAWRYIDRFTDTETGLCAGTVQQGATTVINREATLWDLASQLHGIRVAHQLGFLPRDEAADRVVRLVQHLPLAEVEGHPLPPAMFRTDDLTVVAPGFDICDAGRFLIALRAVVTAGLLDPVTAELVVADWDLAAALPGGRPHSHLNGQWIDTTLSHCTPYIRRGMAMWGFDLVSPYPGLARGTAADRQIALFYDVARIGQLGVEPGLLDRIELGPDPEVDLIADALFDAQLSWFEATGQFKCASEAPLNFAPWFSYQGLRLGYLGPEAWVVRGLGGAAEYDTPDFRAKAELLSTKSAYLWAALRRHDWCDQLLALIRDKTRIEGLGFSVGVFTGNLRAMRNYTDLNTNGVILTAIGHVLA